MRIAFNRIVDIGLDAHAFEAVTELVGCHLSVVVGDNYRAHHEVALHELVAQAQHILVVGDAQIRTYLIAFDVFGTDDDDNLYAVTQLCQHAQLTVGLETRQDARSVVIVE